MGKKLKFKKNSIWDITDVDQQKVADRLYEMEKNADITSVFDLDKKKNKSRVDADCMTPDLRKQISKDLGGTNVDVDDEEDVTDKVTINDTLFVPDEEKDLFASICNTIGGTTEYSDTENYSGAFNDGKYVPSIKFVIMESLDRLSVFDAIAPSSISMDVALDMELDDTLERMSEWDNDVANDYDIDSWEDFIVDTINYIISLKHPTAVYFEDDFLKKANFDRLDGNRSFNTDKFFFLRKAPYIFAYYIDSVTLAEFDEFIREKTDAYKAIKFLITSAYSAGMMNNAFFAEDTDYIEAFRKSVYNNDEEFIELFINDPDTQFEESIDEFVRPVEIEDIESLQSTVREYITDLTGSPYFGEDDEDDEEDYDDDEEEDEEDSEEVEDDTDEDEEEDEEDNEEDDSSLNIPSVSDAVEADRAADESLIEGAQTVQELEEQIDNAIDELLSDDMEDVEVVEPAKEDIELKSSPSSKPVSAPKKETKKVVESSDDDDDFTIPVIRKK